MNLTLHGLSVSVPDSQLERLVLDRLRANEPFSFKSAPPRIGEVWLGQGGIYAGICRGRDDGPDYHLIVGPEHDGTLNWSSAKTWADELSNGEFTDYGLPFRKEQALCFANVPELFKADSYWSCEQHESSSGDAWFQDFSYGSQYNWNKNYELRARSVRRVPIQ